MIAEIERLRVPAQQAAQRFVAWWENEYEALAKQIAAGLALQDAAAAAGAPLAAALERARGDSDAAVAGGVPEIEGVPPAWAYVGRDAKHPRMLICLPAVEPGPPICWPHGVALSPVQTGERAAYQR